VALRLYLLHPAKTEVSIIEGVLLKASLLGGVGLGRCWRTKNSITYTFWLFNIAMDNHHF